MAETTVAGPGQRWLTDSTPDPRFRVYTRANAGEVLSQPCSPLGWTLFWDGAIIPGWRDAYLRLGVLLPDEVPETDPPMCGNFGGYLYNNLSMVRTWSIRTPGGSADAGDRAFIGDHPDLPAYVPDPRDDHPEAKTATAGSIGRILAATGTPHLDEERDRSLTLRAQRPDFAALDDRRLVEHARELVPWVRELFALHTVASIGGAIGPAMLAGLAAHLGDDSLPMRLVAGLGEVDSAAPSLALWELSRTVRASAALTEVFDDGLDDILGRLSTREVPDTALFLERFERFRHDFGSRGPDEWDIARDTWETNPALALVAIDRARRVEDTQSPIDRQPRLAADRDQLADELLRRLAGDPEQAQTLDTALGASRVWLRGRERAKTTIVRVLHEARMALRELGRRHTAIGHLEHPGQLNQLRADELDAYLDDPVALTAELAEREQRFRALHTLAPPYFIDGAPPPLAEWPSRTEQAGQPAESGQVLPGVRGAPGAVTGRVRVVLTPDAVVDLDPGDVLVAPTTDPSWTPLFLTAAAVVVETGAQTSHAVIVARELGVPCVPSVEGATQRLVDGALVTVDGNAGTVTVLDSAAPEEPAP